MKDVLDSLGATVVVIGSGPVLSLRLATRWLRLPWPIVRDPDRSVYRQYGLARPLGLIQQSGTFVVDRDGILRYAHGGLNPWDALRQDEVVAILRRLQN
jgi:peroxiredoxin